MPQAATITPYRTQEEDKGYISVPLKDYNEIIEDNARLRFMLEQAQNELKDRKTIEAFKSEIILEIKGIVTDSDTKKQREIQVPTFINQRNRR